MTVEECPTDQPSPSSPSSPDEVLAVDRGDEAPNRNLLTVTESSPDSRAQSATGDACDGGDDLSRVLSTERSADYGGDVF